MRRTSDGRTTVLYRYFAIIFLLSGFTGLVCETVWARYLRLFLGSAAFAQSFTLVVFMGGMSAGAWAAARYGAGGRGLLFRYAAVEAGLGIMSLAFHPIFENVTGLAYHNIFPAMAENPMALELVKWALAAGLILPQSVLLGATFPLMTAGIVRILPDRPGSVVSYYYFMNCLGASLGALFSGFVFLENLGLPGSMMAAGAINLALAAAVLAAQPGGCGPAIAAAPAGRTGAPGGGLSSGWILAVAGLTGMASFFYETGWIRILSMTLGSSSRSFEVMLSAFILGLALGSALIKRRIERLHNHLLALAVVQIAMGALALATVKGHAVSNMLINAMASWLERDAMGYYLFHASAHATAMAVMLPATVMAGMTLPLMTHYLILRGGGEEAIGRVYAANTLGSILGAILGVNLIMPLAGVNNLIIAGAAADMAVGVALYAAAGLMWRGLGWRSAMAFCLVMMAAGVALSGWKMGPSLAWLAGGKQTPEAAQSMYHKDGRSFTVDVERHGGADPVISVYQNRLPQALLGVNSPTYDDVTRNLLATIPMDCYPEVSKVALVGMGSGLTGAAVMQNPRVARLDTLEIEPAMVEGAKTAGQDPEELFSNARSVIHIGDAKTYFAATNDKYGLIISEPSQTWLDGVAGLFTTEFYAMVRGRLAPEGALAQWTPLFNMRMELLAGVMKGISDNFPDYDVYLATDEAILVIASNSPAVGRPTGWVFGVPAMAEGLKWRGKESLEDFTARRLGGKRVLDPLFRSYPGKANSDYHPALEMGAIRESYIGSNAYSLAELKTFPVPVVEALEGGNPPAYPDRPRAELGFALVDYARGGKALLRAIGGQPSSALAPEMQELVRRLLSPIPPCGPDWREEEWIKDINQVAFKTIPYLPPPELKLIFEKLSGRLDSRCAGKAASVWLRLHGAIAARDFSTAASVADTLLPRYSGSPSMERDYLLAGATLGRIMDGRAPEALRLLQAEALPGDEAKIALRLLKATARVRTGE